MNAIELSGVNKTFGRVTALRDLNLSVRAGELTALLGPNGAGKTTAINLMLGWRRPARVRCACWAATHAMTWCAPGSDRCRRRVRCRPR